MSSKREYTVILDPDPEGRGFTVHVPALPGCITQGRTRDEAIRRAREAILVHLEGLMADGEPLPDDVTAVEVLKVAV
ncbi:MAG: type II toxin-antitoxin system HicB family antitoxin [Chloroflexi bacterium]|nr:type II toxin-antitoxin system HicB family antitoxin [Chloroflexota bacterium]